VLVAFALVFAGCDNGNGGNGTGGNGTGTNGTGTNGTGTNGTGTNGTGTNGTGTNGTGTNGTGTNGSTTPTPKVTITFDANRGALIGDAAAEIDKDTKLDADDVPFATRDFFELIGWNTAANGEGDDLDLDAAFAASVKFYAVWDFTGERVFYDLQLDNYDDLRYLGSFGGSNSGIHPNGFLTSSSGSSRTLPDEMPRVLTVRARTGSGQGMRVLNTINDLTIPTFSYRFEYGGEMSNVSQTVFDTAPITTGVNFARIRLESGNTTSAANVQGTGENGDIVNHTNNVLLARSPEYNIGEVENFNFNIQFTSTAEVLAAMLQTSISFGDNRNGNNISGLNFQIIYKHFRIVEIAPNEEAVIALEDAADEEDED